LHERKGWPMWLSTWFRCRVNSSGSRSTDPTDTIRSRGSRQEPIIGRIIGQLSFDIDRLSFSDSGDSYVSDLRGAMP